MILAYKALLSPSKYAFCYCAFMHFTHMIIMYELLNKTSAGMFEQVKILLPTFYTQSPTWDMSSEALTAYSTIMLAQAQECIYIKAERGMFCLWCIFLISYLSEQVGCVSFRWYEADDCCQAGKSGSFTLQ